MAWPPRGRGVIRKENDEGVEGWLVVMRRP
jgi:hypothetical protein